MADTARLRALSDTALGMAFGMCVQSRPGTTPPGALAVIADELTRRGQLAALLAAFDTQRAGAVRLMISVDRTRVRRSGGRAPTFTG